MPALDPFPWLDSSIPRRSLAACFQANVFGLLTVVTPEDADEDDDEYDDDDQERDVMTPIQTLESTTLISPDDDDVNDDVDGEADTGVNDDVDDDGDNCGGDDQHILSRVKKIVLSRHGDITYTVGGDEDNDGAAMTTRGTVRWKKTWK